LKKVAAIVAATAVAMVLGVMAYQSNNKLEVTQYDKKANSTDFMLPQFVTAPGFSIEQVRGIQKEVCGGIGREDWVPQEVFFAYLEPREAVFRIPCGIGPAGHFFRTFYISGSVPTIIDEYHPNAQSLFDVASKEQAAEYVMYFSVVLAGEMGNKQFVLTEDQYDKWAGQCNANDTSVAKKLTVTVSGENHVVDLNFVDRTSGSFEHRQYLVTRDGGITLLDKKSLGNCGFAI
jgi:hypothetical protein